MDNILEISYRFSTEYPELGIIYREIRSEAKGEQGLSHETWCTHWNEWRPDTDGESWGAFIGFEPSRVITEAEALAFIAKCQERIAI
jgi:hypothetical protein